MAEDLDKLRLQVTAHRRRKDVPEDTKMLLKRLMETLGSYDAGEVPSGEVCLRILRGDFDYNLEVIQSYTERRLDNPDRRKKTEPLRGKHAKKDDDDDL